MGLAAGLVRLIPLTVRHSRERGDLVGKGLEILAFAGMTIGGDP